MSNTKRLFLLDAYALIYRAHFAFTKTPRINSKGINTSVAFGFTNTLLEVLQKQRPTHIAVAFDMPGKTFRDEIFAAYKATRQETPEDIRAGIPICKQIIRGFNIPILEMEGYEADDIIGTISRQACTKDFDVYMMTPDKDFGQLVNECVFLYKPAYMGNAVDVLGPKEVCEKWDIENVSQVIDILGLQGDTSDNIPGIPGFGPKTAATLLKQYKTVENIVAHANDLKGKQKELVLQYGDQAILSKKLATIYTEVPIEFNEDTLAYAGPNADVLKPIFNDLEFKTISARVFGEAAPASAPVRATPQGSQLSMFGGGGENTPVDDGVKKNFDASIVQYTRIENEGQLAALLEKVKEQSVIALDSLMDDATNFDYQLKALSISFKEREAYFIPLGNEEDSKQFVKIFADALKNDALAKTGHNLKVTMLALKKIGAEVKGTLFDTMVAHYLIEPEASHDIFTLCSQYLQYDLLPESHQDLRERLCERADLVLQLQAKLKRDLEERRQVRLLRDTEMPLIKVLAAMEYEGVKVDVNALGKMSEELRSEIEKVQRDVYAMAGSEFNIGSPKQLGEVLFEKMKLIDKPKKTKSGQYATGEDVLLSLASKHEIVQKILDYREFDKLRSTYVEALPKMISKFDGRIHTDYRQAVAATGRLSSNNPNLQNIPIRTAKGKLIRKAFVARGEDFHFMSADYSQIELRIAASFAKDEIMIEAFRNKRDIHTTTAAKVFKVPLEHVTPDMRRKAKEVNFGILYGSTAFGLSQNLGISRTEAQEIIQSYFTEFPSIKRYMDDAINAAREKEFVETILGRRRYLRDINSRNITTRGFAERNAINAPIQGSAADIIKIAMINIHRWLNKENLKSKMIMQVHDELVFDVHKDEVDVVKENVAFLMKHAVNLEVPMEVEVGIATNWLDAH
ncbi:DNA polymerase I [Pseudochryseolinea flava]|uniref:DNA polymerase I n=1 Tax=Pseudochryseolinea flava TaxID=2059302 RepID=A0A364YA43_9BACT|nr:DNA polymerase I [Pseudochryseolinea flava]RAW03285.1 DNA polymerase I [Pseudochryseolinea flava]